ncbi:hypothetical protein [Planctomicrobium sp. SH664]|uniref:hypothetical protein n=1 Tax=Planctomicrobium sp. SH664 TaxID=3448125 RepID=UPI003F5C6889
MFNNQWPAPGSTNWQMSVFTAGALTILAVTLAAALGPEAATLLIKSALMLVFLAGGGVIGLIVTHHICETHLPVTSEQAESPETPIRALTASSQSDPTPQRGFLALFGTSPQTSETQPTGRRARPAA